MGTGKTIWVIPICAVLTGERDCGPAAQPLHWSWVNLNDLPALVTGPLATSKLAYREESGCCLPVIKIRDLSRGCCSSRLVHMPPSSVSLPRWRGQAGGRASACLIPAQTGSQAGMCSQTWGLRSASRGPPLAPNLCVPLSKSLKVTVPRLFRCNMGALQLSSPVLSV